MRINTMTAEATNCYLSQSPNKFMYDNDGQPEKA